MFFRNLKLFRLTGLLTSLEEQLARGAFYPCPGHQPISRGWVPPTSGCGLLYQQGQSQMLALKTEQRLLPADVVAKEAAIRAEAIAFEQGHPVGRKQLREIKERVIEELMPKAFTRLRTTRVWINQAAGWLVVDTGSSPEADAVISHLRHSLDEVPLAFPATIVAPAVAMADWLASADLPDGFTLDDAAQLKGVGEKKATVTYQHHTVDGALAIRDQMASGLLPTKLAMTWDGRISFTLTEELDIKRVSFLDFKADHFDTDFALMSGELLRFLPALMDAFDGEAFAE